MITSSGIIFCEKVRNDFYRVVTPSYDLPKGTLVQVSPSKAELVEFSDSRSLYKIHVEDIEGETNAKNPSY